MLLQRTALKQPCFKVCQFFWILMKASLIFLHIPYPSIFCRALRVASPCPLPPPPQYPRRTQLWRPRQEQVELQSRNANWSNIWRMSVSLSSCRTRSSWKSCRGTESSSLHWKEVGRRPHAKWDNEQFLIQSTSLPFRVPPTQILKSEFLCKFTQPGFERWWFCFFSKAISSVYSSQQDFVMLCHTHFVLFHTDCLIYLEPMSGLLWMTSYPCWMKNVKDFHNTCILCFRSIKIRVKEIQIQSFIS